MTPILELLASSSRHRADTWLPTTIKCRTCGFLVTGAIGWGAGRECNTIVDSANFVVDSPAGAICNACLGEAWTFLPDTPL